MPHRNNFEVEMATDDILRAQKILDSPKMKAKVKIELDKRAKAAQKAKETVFSKLK